ncbi:hypothetical protein EG329_001343 [Mollisiaceae sp. DMI_Dod_QoI]|nr:hypothetical protein EG329_001343 [Helotiales sp. DMI_Dod_QoI]
MEANIKALDEALKNSPTLPSGSNHPISADQNATMPSVITEDNQNKSFASHKQKNWTEEEQAAFYLLLRNHFVEVKNGTTATHVNSMMKTFSDKLKDNDINKTRQQCQWHWYSTARYLPEFLDNDIDSLYDEDDEDDVDYEGQDLKEGAMSNVAEKGQTQGSKWTDQERQKFIALVKARRNKEKHNPALEKLNSTQLMTVVSSQLKKQYSIDRTVNACKQVWRRYLASHGTEDISDQEPASSDSESELVLPPLLSPLPAYIEAMLDEPPTSTKYQPRENDAQAGVPPMRKGEKKGRKIVRFTPEQRRLLDQEAKENGLSPSAEVLNRLADDCGVEAKKVKDWFTNARAGRYGYDRTIGQRTTQHKGNVEYEDTDHSVLSSNSPSNTAGASIPRTSLKRSRLSTSKAINESLVIDSDDDDHPRMFPSSKKVKTDAALEGSFNAIVSSTSDNNREKTPPGMVRKRLGKRDPSLPLMSLEDYRKSQNPSKNPSKNRHSTETAEAPAPGTQFLDNNDIWSVMTSEKIRRLEEQMAALHATKDRMLAEISRDEEILKDFQEQIKKLCEKKAVLKQAIDTKKDKVDDYTTKINTAKDKKQKLQDALTV